MNALVLHLSDSHFRVTRNTLLNRAEAIGNAVLGAAESPDVILVAFSGDIAFSGLREEYEQAESFVHKLRSVLTRAAVPVHFAFAPGNHDCDFGKQSDVRHTSNDLPMDRLVAIDPSGEMAAQCVAVQKEFFGFAAKLNGYAFPSIREQLLFRQSMVHGSAQLRVHCYNTAWLSQLKERQGRLGFPTRLLEPDPGHGTSDIDISIFHHSYFWLESVNGRAFRRFIEQTSDLVLTGHDHVSDAYTKRSLAGSIARYVEGAVLQSGSDDESGFNVVLLDVARKREKVLQYGWNGRIYDRLRAEVEWVPFIRNPLLSIAHFRTNDDFAAYLSDAGSGFTHRFKKHIALEDLYVYPDLRRLTAQPDPEATYKHTLRGDELINFFDDNRHAVVVGAERSGKTSLCKMLYSSLQAVKGKVPVLVSGDELRTFDRDRIDALFEGKFENQYSRDLLERFRQLPQESKALLIDDFDKVKLNRRGRKILVDHARQRFGTVIVFVDDLFHLEELTGAIDSEHPLGAFEQCQIQEFGHVLRGALIERWCSLGRELTVPDTEIAREVATAEKLVTTVIGNNLLPSSPITVLTMLQAHEAGQQQSTISGSYGYIYEVLITAALSLVSSKGADVDTKYTFLGLIANHLFESERDSISIDELHSLQDLYYSKYRIRLDLQRILRELTESRLLQSISGSHRFRYKYAYYYFVARYLKDNMDEVPLEVRTSLNEMADKVYYEEYSNILMFFVYLTRDRGVIDRLLSNAKGMFAEYEACDFESHVEFVNRLFKEGARPLALPDGEIDEHRRSHREQLDLIARDDAPTALEGGEPRLVAYEKDLDDLVRLNIGLKTLEILGQILRNFPGSLRGDLKAELTREAYLLGLRTIRAVVSVAEKNFEELRAYFVTVIKDRRVVRERDERALEKNADELLIWTSVGCAYSLVKRVSGAVGLEELGETYREILEDGSNTSNSLSFRIIDTTIKLDHFAAFPEAEVHDLAKALHRNYFGWSILRHLILDYMYLFPVDYKIRQQMGELINVRSSHPKLIDNPQKRLRS